MRTKLKNGIIFIPETDFKKHTTFYDYQIIDSFGLPIKIIIGARGIGKTYGAKKKIIKGFIYNNNTFIWLRDTESALDNLKEQNGLPFFDDVQNKVFTHNFEGCILDESILINDNNAGRLMALSTMHNKKGNSFDTFKTIVFDEFIAEKDQVIRGNRTRQFLNAIQTAGRLRNDFNCYLLANALDRGNEIIKIFDFKIMDYGYYINREKMAVLHYASNSAEFEKLNEMSIAGRIVKGTAYEDVITNNTFNDDDKLYYDKKPTNCKVLCILANSDSFVRIYIAGDTLYASADFNSGAYEGKRYVTDIKNVNLTYKLIPPTLFDALKKLWSNGKIYFENAYIKNAFVQIMMKK